MSYPVYKARYRLALVDLDMPQPRYHTVLFVEMKSDRSGEVIHVTGDLVKGMKYERKMGKRPEDSATFHSKELIGYIAKSSYPNAVDDICKKLPGVPIQKKFNPKSHKTEQMKEDGSFYAEGEKRPQMTKCTEWVEGRAIPALRDLLNQDSPTAVSRHETSPQGQSYSGHEPGSNPSALFPQVESTNRHQHTSSAEKATKSSSTYSQKQKLLHNGFKQVRSGRTSQVIGWVTRDIDGEKCYVNAEKKLWIAVKDVKSG